jgi:hypothetical protein
MAYDVTGKAPIRTGWVDTNKGTADVPVFRSRWVAKEFNTGPRPDLFAATTPLEGFKLVLSQAASSSDPHVVVAVIDVRHAYFYAPARRDVFVKLPDEDYATGDYNRCGRLRVSLYGTRDAAQNWAEELGGYLATLGMTRGKSNPCIFCHAPSGATAAVHGDDVTVQGNVTYVKKLIDTFKSKYEIKTQIIDKTGQELKVLNRMVSWTPLGLTLEADPRHAQEVVEALGLEKANTVATPGTAEDNKEGESDTGTMVSKTDQTRYRAVAARLNYLSQDRPDIRYATMRACACMSCPTTVDFERLKRIGRFLLKKPRLVISYVWQRTPVRIDGYSDSDWAGDRSTRRSASGGCLLHGLHWVKGWAKSQQVIALSSAEAELYAMTRTCSETIGAQSILNDLMSSVRVRVHVDSSVAISLAHREGLGKAKHIAIQHLWMQERVKAKDVEVVKVLGRDNPADLFTNNLTADRTVYLLGIMGCSYV